MRQPVAYRSPETRTAIVEALEAADNLAALELAARVESSYDAWVSAENRLAKARREGDTGDAPVVVLETEAEGRWEHHKRLVDQAEARLAGLDLQQRTDSLAQRFATRRR